MEAHNDEHFKFWNDFDVPGNSVCYGNRTQSILLCNGFSKMTFNLTLQIVGILALYLLVFCMSESVFWTVKSEFELILLNYKKLIRIQLESK